MRVEGLGLRVYRASRRAPQDKDCFKVLRDLYRI